MKKEKAIKEDCYVWPEYAVSTRFPNRDETVDEVEASDLRATGYREDAPAPIKCLGFACPASSDVCDICHLNPSFVPPKRPVVQAQNNDSLRDAKLDARLSAPTFRGNRARMAW